MDLSTKNKKETQHVFVQNSIDKGHCDSDHGIFEDKNDAEILEQMLNHSDDASVTSFQHSPKVQSTKRRNSISPVRLAPVQRFHAIMEADDDLFVADLDFLD